MASKECKGDWFLFRPCPLRLVPTLRVGMHTRTLRVRAPQMHGRNKNQHQCREIRKRPDHPDPASLETSVTFTLPGSVVYATVFSAVLGKRVIVKYTSGVPELRIDGQHLATGSAGASGTLKIEMDSAILNSARVFNKTIYDWRWHAVVFNAGHFSSRTLERRYRLMRESQRNGAGADDEPVYGEVPAILGTRPALGPAGGRLAPQL